MEFFFFSQFGLYGCCCCSVRVFVCVWIACAVSVLARYLFESVWVGVPFFGWLPPPPAIAFPFELVRKCCATCEISFQLGLKSVCVVWPGHHRHLVHRMVFVCARPPYCICIPYRNNREYGKIPIKFAIIFEIQLHGKLLHMTPGVCKIFCILLETAETSDFSPFKPIFLPLNRFSSLQMNEKREFPNIQ